MSASPTRDVGVLYTLAQHYEYSFIANTRTINKHFRSTTDPLAYTLANVIAMDERYVFVL
jgi:hypothetical protein